MWGLIGGGGALVLLVVGLLAFMLGRSGNSSGKDQPDKDNQQAVVNQNNKDAPKDAPIKDVANNFLGRDAVKDGGAKDQPPRDLAPRDQVAKDQPPRDKPADPLPTGDGSLPRELIEKVKAATLFIHVVSANGQKATGSGFFESSSGMILTNAHVVDMLKEDSAPPRSIQAIMNSNRPGERKFAAKIVSVDRLSDLAVLSVEVPAEEMKTFPTLTVAPAKDLLETQRVYVSGFPFGEDVGKNVTISTTSVSSLQHENGVLSKVQVNGGMHPGNSGGPVIDARGNVIGVAVSGIEGTLINFAIPGEQVFSLLDGRLSTINVANEPTIRDGKFVVPVRIGTIDPNKKIQKVAIDYWVGPSNANPIKPSESQPDLGPLNTARKTVVLAYNAETRNGQAELILDAVPADGSGLWIQSVVTNGSGKTKWMGARPWALAAPVDAKPSTLVFQPKKGTQPLSIKSTARFYMEARGEKAEYLKNVEARLNEVTTAVQGNVSQVRLSVSKFQTGISVNNKAPELSEATRQAQTKDIGKLGIDVIQDAKGNLIKKTNDLRQVPALTKREVDRLGSQVCGSLDLVAIPQPGTPVQPGQTWQARRELPFDLPTSTDDNAVLAITYTYRGVRQHNGRTVAVLALSGGLSSGRRGGGNLRGKINGTAMIDPTNGMVISATAVVDARATLRFRGEVMESKGTLDIRLTRGPDVK
jgi:S1-C subfamily serine protease